MDSGADTGGGGGGRQDLRTPLRFQNCSPIALKGKKNKCQTEKIFFSKKSSAARLCSNQHFFVPKNSRTLLT